LIEVRRSCKPVSLVTILLMDSLFPFFIGFGWKYKSVFANLYLPNWGRKRLYLTVTFSHLLRHLTPTVLYGRVNRLYIRNLTDFYKKGGIHIRKNTDFSKNSRIIQIKCCVTMEKKFGLR